MAQEYRIVATQPFTYIDNLNQIVNGYKVFVELLQFNENHFVLVSTLNPDTVKNAVVALVTQRKALAGL